MQDAYIVSATRTPVGKAFRGSLSKTRPDDMLAHVIQNAVSAAGGIDPARIEDAIIGCAMPEGPQGMNIARIGVLLAGLPDAVPGVTVNRFCSSGLQTIAMAADRIRLGEADLMLAGGTESMTMVPMMGNKVEMNPALFSSEHINIAYGMGITAENVADKYAISREDQDQFAYNSHIKALAAQESGIATGIVPIATRSYQTDGSVVQVREGLFSADEGARADSSLEILARLRTVFKANGSVTAANSSQMSDGAAALMLASEAAVKEYNLQPLAVFRGFSVAGVPPEIMGIGPIAAIPKVLKQTGIHQDDLDWIELNEAFAAQALAVIKDTGLNPEKINPLGGAISLGHPLGATGAILSTKMIHAMREKKLKYGMVTMCIGTGMGAAGIFEILN
ncbi:MAG: acetyl-CoA C-acyltransferase [Xanthomonadales bacterium]|nr:acetyl-CoA C-acyltransferase [Xanthomonadales bacterium]